MYAEIERLTAIWKKFRLGQALQERVPDFLIWIHGTGGMQARITFARLIGAAGITQKAKPFAPRDTWLAFGLALVAWRLEGLSFSIMNI